MTQNTLTWVLSAVPLGSKRGEFLLTALLAPFLSACQPQTSATSKHLRPPEDSVFLTTTYPLLLVNLRVGTEHKQLCNDEGICRYRKLTQMTYLLSTLAESRATVCKSCIVSKGRQAGKMKDRRNLGWKEILKKHGQFFP